MHASDLGPHLRVTVRCTDVHLADLKVFMVLCMLKFGQKQAGNYRDSDAAHLLSACACLLALSLRSNPL